ncbi:MAG: thiol-activated cytolysin family protein [Porphyromonas somerae]|uniref:thiol-activated cytolysin family protein n=1 Tax=Porphyromonas somerae TaxID=322095 RepID=UPI0026F263FC|nr:thiol-activated cytolysin family protein [Porphyromonas somerae]MDD7557857.1 thiol-activated cytolysin family protein [Porphyromonas somerae]MDY5815656.1 thiol-activated cytolysin family protein [Porphyromonas somerae]
MKTFKWTLLAATLSLGLVQCTNLPTQVTKEIEKEVEKKIDEKKVEDETPNNPGENPDNPNNPNLLTGDAIINTLRTYAVPNGMIKGDDTQGKKVVEVKSLPGDGKIYNNNGVLTDPNIGNEPGGGYEGDKLLDGVKLYRNKKRYEKATYSEPLVLAQYLESVYPGMVLKSDQITNGAFATVAQYAVNPIKISGNWLATQGTDATSLKSKVIDVPSTSAYRDALIDVFQGFPEESAVKTTLDIQEVDISHEGGISAKYNQKTLMDLGFELDANVSKHKSHLLVRFVQNLFTVSMDLPQFGLLHNINTEGLNGYKPVYVSDIHYGRICYALFSSDALAVDLRASIEAMQKMIFGMSQGGGGSFNYSHVMDNSQVQYVVIGGSQQDHTALMTSGTGLKNILAQPINIRNAAPIAINLRFVDDNSRARVMKAVEMPLQEAIFIPNKQNTLEFGAQLTGIKATYALFKQANVAGVVTIKIPTATGHQTITLLNNTKKNPLIIETGDSFRDVRNSTNKESARILLSSFLNKDKAGYYDQPVEIHVKLNFAGMNGLIDGKELIELNIKKPLRDFIFDCQDGVLQVETKGLGAGINYSVALDISLDPVVTGNYQ